MSIDRFKELPDKYKDAEFVLATNSSSMIQAFRTVYGREISSTDPESVNHKQEPTTGSIQAALFKIREVASTYEGKQLPEGKVVILGADVEFKYKDKTRHKSDRDGEISEREEQKLRKKAVKRYSKPFTVRWKVTFAVQELGGSTRFSQLEILGNYKNGLNPEQINGNFSTKSNALVRLVELGEEAEFSISQYLDRRRIPLEHKHAVMLIKDKVLPPNGLIDLLQNESSSFIDEAGSSLGIINLALITLFTESGQA